MHYVPINGSYFEVGYGLEKLQTLLTNVEVVLCKQTSISKKCNTVCFNQTVFPVICLKIRFLYYLGHTQPASFSKLSEAEIT